MQITVNDIKTELLARIAACENVAYGGIGNEPVRARMRHRATTFRSVLSWITGQEQLAEDPNINALAEELLQGPGSFTGKGPYEEAK